MTVTESASREAVSHPLDFEDPLDRRVYDQLAAEFAGRVGHAHIAAAVAEARERLGEARILTYVPILLERFAREFVCSRIGACDGT